MECQYTVYLSIGIDRISVLTEAVGGVELVLEDFTAVDAEMTKARVIRSTAKKRSYTYAQGSCPE